MDRSRRRYTDLASYVENTYPKKAISYYSRRISMALRKGLFLPVGEDRIGLREILRYESLYSRQLALVMIIHKLYA